MTSTLEPLDGVMDGPLKGPLETLWKAYEASAASSGATALRWSCEDWRLRHRLCVEMRQRVEAQGGTFLGGGWRSKTVRPYDGVLEVLGDLAAVSLEEDSALVDGYGVALINLLPSLASTPRLSHLTPFRSGLAEFALRQDRVGLAEFFWRRDASAFLISEQIRCLLDAAAAAAEGSARPSMLWLDDVQWADTKSLELLQLLLGYAVRRPVCIVLVSDRSETFLATPLETLSVLDDPPDPAEGLMEESGLRWEAWPEPRRRALEVVSVLCLPFDGAAWGRLMPDGNEPDVGDVQEWVERGLLRRVGRRAFRLGSSALRNALYGSLEAERRAWLHGRALELEGTDPLCADWHGESSRELTPQGAPDAGNEAVERTRRALERAWGLSALDLALPLAQRYIEAGTEDGVDGDLLFALLHYDAGQFDASDVHFGLALKQTESPSQRSMLTRLRGNNAVFGLGHLERGRQLLRSVLPRFEAIGLHREACFVRNSIAFTLFREGRLEEAVALENRSLEQLANSPEPGGLLESLLLLNTGRLHRQKGAADQALEHFEAAGQAGGSDLTPYLLQLLRATLAHLRGQRQEWVEAHREFSCCLELSRDLSGDGASYPMFRLLPALPGKLQEGCLTKGDQVELYLHLNLAITSGRAGYEPRSQAYFQGIERRWSFLGEPLRRLLESARAAALPQAGDEKAGGAPASRNFEAQANAAVAHYDELVETTQSPSPEVLAQSLADGQTVAWVQPVAGTAAVQSWVLCDPRHADAARRLSEEFNSYAAPRLRNVWILPQAADAFHGVDGGCPMVLQEAALKRGEEARLPALAPFHLKVQVADPAMDGSLSDLLEALQAQTGRSAVAMVANVVFGWDLAADPYAAIESFLASSVDHLVLGDRLLRKRHGQDAPANLLSFQPRLAIKASVVAQPSEVDGKPQHWLAVRSATARRLLKLNAATHAIVELCDGTRSGHVIAQELANQLAPGQDLSAQVGQCLRTLHRNKAICFVGAVRS